VQKKAGFLLHLAMAGRRGGGLCAGQGAGRENSHGGRLSTNACAAHLPTTSGSLKVSSYLPQLWVKLGVLKMPGGQLNS